MRGPRSEPSQPRLHNAQTLGPTPPNPHCTVRRPKLEPSKPHLHDAQSVIRGLERASAHRTEAPRSPRRWVCNILAGSYSPSGVDRARAGITSEALSVEAHICQGARTRRSTATSRTSNAGRWDGSALRDRKLFLREPIGPLATPHSTSPQHRKSPEGKRPPGLFDAHERTTGEASCTP